jgi:uncharacterized protein (DUF1684 family)
LEPPATMTAKMSFLKPIFLALFITGSSITVSSQTSEKLRSILEFREWLNEEYKDPERSPLSEQEIKEFRSHDFFPTDTTFVIEAAFVRTPYENPFEMETTTERRPVYVKYGEVFFDLGGKEYKLNVYQSLDLKKTEEYKDYLFLPFTDLTNGTSSYSGGRYLDLKIPDAKKITLDFNKAYNPFCAYSGKYSCPVPPSENDLPIKVTAGVRLEKH